MIIKIGFSRPKAWFKPGSWLIRLSEGTKYSHVYLSWTTSVGVDIVYQASHTMVNFMSKVNFDKQALVIEEYETEISNEAYSRLLKYCLTNAGTDYGNNQILGIAIQRIFGLKKNPFSDGRDTQVCSELVGYVIKDYLHQDTALDLDSIGPRDINTICQAHFKRIT